MISIDRNCSADRFIVNKSFRPNYSYEVGYCSSNIQMELNSKLPHIIDSRLNSLLRRTVFPRHLIYLGVCVAHPLHTQLCLHVYVCVKAITPSNHSVGQRANCKQHKFNYNHAWYSQRRHPPRRDLDIP